MIQHVAKGCSRFADGIGSFINESDRDVKLDLSHYLVYLNMAWNEDQGSYEGNAFAYR